MPISNDSKMALKSRLKEISAQMIHIDLDITQVQNQKQPYDDKLSKLREQMERLRAEKQAIQGDLT